MMLREVVHLRKQVTELQALSTAHVAERQGGPQGWVYDHQMSVGPVSSVEEVFSMLLEVVREQGAPGPDRVGYGIRIIRGEFCDGWFGNVIWKAQ